MPLSCLMKPPQFSKEISWYLENSCKAPSTMKLDPPLPAGYTAWIHRAGWILYVHDSTKTGSWMHPVKLAGLEARGLKGPGKLGPEMYIWEPNVNRGGYYVIDYGYPPMGKPHSGTRPIPTDFQDIDRMGYAAWETQNKTRAAAAMEDAYEKLEQGVLPDGVGSSLPQGWAEAMRKAMQEQGIESRDDIETDEQQNRTEIVSLP